MALCIATASGVTKLAITLFTLSWTHSVEKTSWQEDWRIANGRLEIVEARVEGSGAGMEPGVAARFDGRFWRWRPALAPLAELALRNSQAIPEGWKLCSGQTCHILGGAKSDLSNRERQNAVPDDTTSDVIRLSACND